jgi:hypothetical protein
MTGKIQIIETGEDRQAPLDVYLGHLQNGQFLTSPTGFWRKHDEDSHFARIKSLRPDEVIFVMDAAQVARELLHADGRAYVEYVAEHIDSFLDNYHLSQEYGRVQLETLLGRYSVQRRLF